MNYLLEVILKEILKADETKSLANGVSQIREKVLAKCGARMRQARPRVTLKRLDSFVVNIQDKRSQSINRSNASCFQNSDWSYENNHNSFEGFSDNDELIIQTEEASASPMFDVKICKSEIEMKGNDKELQNRVKCSKCDLTFGRKLSLTRHIKAVHMKLRPFKCTLCYKSFPRMEQKKLHKCKILPPIDLLKFSCEICEKSFGYQDHLETHKRFVHAERKFKCGTCGMAFKTKQNLNRHVLTKHDKQMFPCKVPDCAKSFAHPQYLERHYKMNHPDFQASVKRIQKPKKFTTLRKNGKVWKECSICSKSYSSRHGVLYHWKQVHDQGGIS